MTGENEFKNPAAVVKIVSLFNRAMAGGGLKPEHQLELDGIIDVVKGTVASKGADPFKNPEGVARIVSLFASAMGRDEVTPEHRLEIDEMLEALKKEPALEPVAPENV